MAMAAPLDEQLASWSKTTQQQRMMPMTPPHTERLNGRGVEAPYPVQGQLLTPPDDEETEKEKEPLAWAHDWLHVSRARPESAALVAEKTCEMICYLWFASRTAPPSALQLTASPTFVTFTQKLLETTQVSQSVIVLALHYIQRLRLAAAPAPAPAPPQPGSEFRVAVAALLLANKFLDDNTYTNATWASVSGIPLAQINVMEREFLVGCGWNMYVSEATYGDWGRLLRGLVGARRAQVGRWRERRERGGRELLRGARRAPGVSGGGPSPARRRRSVSPRPRPVYVPPPEEMNAEWGAGGAGSKRRAAAAFSPTSYHPPAAVHHHWPVYAEYTHPQRPAPTLVIPQAQYPPSSSSSTSYSSNSFSNTPLERFGMLSLNSSTSATSSYRSTTRTRTPSPPRLSVTGRRARPVSYAGASASSDPSPSYRPPTTSAHGFAASPDPSPSYRPPASTSFEYVPPPPSTIVQYPPHAHPPTLKSSPSSSRPSPSPQQQKANNFETGALAAGWEYAFAQQGQQGEEEQRKRGELYFYQLQASPVSGGSEAGSEGKMDMEMEEDERCECEECRAAATEAEEEWGSEEEEEEDAASSVCSDHGYDGDERMPYINGGQRHPPPPPHDPNPNPTARIDALRRARLRCVPAPPPAPVAPAPVYPPPHTRSHPSAPAAPLDHSRPSPAASFLLDAPPSAPRWGVQSARTSPVRTSGTASSAPYPPYQYSYQYQYPKQEWTPPRLPRFAEFERWSTPLPPISYPPPAPKEYGEGYGYGEGARGTTKRGVFANAGPPGVSGYAYAWGYA